MTIERTYRCNLCGTSADTTEKLDELIGIYFNHNNIEHRYYRNVEHHICRSCASDIHDI